MDIRAETVADAFFSGWIARFGTPATITTDRGAQFESKLWDGLCNQFGIVRNRTTSYHPQSNGMVERFHRQLRVAMSSLRLCPPCDSPQNNIFQYKEIYTCSNVFLRRIAIAPPLTAPYDGPYKVIVRSGRVMKILIKGKVETVSLDRVKPAHLDNEPEIGTEKQCETQNNTKIRKILRQFEGHRLSNRISKRRELNRGENTDTFCGGSKWYEFDYYLTA